jgi:ABC-2 type transport system ATP-binding protein
VGIAQAIIHEPVLVVLDEPTNGLDPNQILEIRHLIKEIAEERTVILSTHILSEVQATCDYIRMVEQGQIVFAGTVEEFDNYIAPSTLLVSLMDAPPVADLTAIEGVVGVEELGNNRFRLKFTDAREVVERVVKASVEHDWRLMEVGVERNSLDSIFAELSRKGK